MGRDEPDEADCTGRADRQSRQHGAEYEEQDLEAPHRQADAGGLDRAARENVEMAAERHARRGREDQHEQQPRPARGSRQVAKQPEDHAPEAGVVAQGEQQAHDGASARRDHDPREQQAGGRPATRALCQCEHQQARAERTRRRSAVDTCGRHSRHDCEQGCDRGTTGDAEHVGIGQRIAQQDLQHGSRECQQAPDREGRERPWQAQLQQDVPRNRLVPRGKGCDDFGQCQGQAAQREGRRKQRGDGEGEQQQRGGEGQSTVHLALGTCPSLRRVFPRPQDALPGKPFGRPRPDVKKSVGTGAYEAMSDFIDTEGFRANVGIVLIRDGGEVFLGSRSDGRGWQFPQGGVKRNESPDEAVFRELREEIGLERDDVEVLASTRDWLRYRLPRQYVRRRSRPLCIGQKQRWFLLRLLGDEQHLRFDLTGQPEFDDWRWVDYWAPVREVIFFKRVVYAQALTELGRTAFPGGPPPLPDWWSEDVLRPPGRSRQGTRPEARPAPRDEAAE